MSPFLKIFSYSWLVLVLIGGFNFIVDPYGIFNGVQVAGVNFPKPQAHNHEMLVKSYLVSEVKPDSIALGTSRVGYGIDPRSRSWKGYGSKYNLSMADGSVYVTRRILEHAIAIKMPKQVLIGLDFFAFNAMRKNTNDHTEELLAVKSNGDVNKEYKRHIILSSVLSYSSLKASIKTIRGSREPRIQVLNPETGMRQYAINGQIYDNDKLFNLAELDWEDNAHKAFMAHAGYYTAKKYFIGKDREYYFKDKDSGNSPVEEFRKIVQLCNDNNIELVVFVAPIHVWHTEVIRAIGLWPLFEQWKRELVLVLEKEHSGTPYNFWDFSGYNSVTSVDVPEGRMREYQDSSHYTPVVGNMVLSRVFAQDANSIPVDFGRRLTANNIENVLGLIRIEQQKYHDSHPELVKMMDKTAARLNVSAEDVIVDGGKRPIGARAVKPGLF